MSRYTKRPKSSLIGRKFPLASKYYYIRKAYLFFVDNLRVVKKSIDRIFIKGSRFDRDMHGAQLANLISELMIE
ncbi:MAG: hypothetical protein ACJZ8S_04345 [Paracoccaceae bacterium]